MPFANKFRFSMGMPEPGDIIGRFTVETCEVEHVGIRGGRYEYPVEMVLAGKGGQQGVRNDLKSLLGSRKTTFSGYGNPYQLHFDRAEVESLGNGKYRVSVCGIGNRIFLKKELTRFLTYLAMKDGEAKISASGEREAAIDEYLADYQADARKKRQSIPC